MKVLNIHERTIPAPLSDVQTILSSLATKNDRAWPTKHWPPMQFKNGLALGNDGRHGPIVYRIIEHDPNSKIVFQFQKPRGFHGVHQFDFYQLNASETYLKHTIDINTSFIGTIQWLVAIRWLHDALIEDAFDKIHNHFIDPPRRTPWTFWVKCLRKILG